MHRTTIFKRLLTLSFFPWPMVPYTFDDAPAIVDTNLCLPVKADTDSFLIWKAVGFYRDDSDDNLFYYNNDNIENMRVSLSVADYNEIIMTDYASSLPTLPGVNDSYLGDYDYTRRVDFINGEIDIINMSKIMDGVEPSCP